VPDLQLDDSHYELKGIRVDSPRTNYNSGVRSTGFSTGVAKKELSTANLMAEKAAKLDRDAHLWRGRGPPGAVAAAARGDRRHQAAGLWSVWGDGARPRSAPC
jgi:hypothetical protein